MRIPYCSGDLYLGTRTSNVSETYGLWFAGFNILKAVLAELNSTASLSSCTDIIWAGESAGAIAAFLTVDYVQASFPRSRVTVVSNGGFFSVEVPWPGSGKSNILPSVFPLWQPRVPAACATALGLANSSDCTIADIFMPYLSVPSFWVQSVDDLYLLGITLGFNESALSGNPVGALSFLTNFYNSRLSKFQAKIFNRPSRSYWVTSAVLHVITPADNCSSSTWI